MSNPVQGSFRYRRHNEADVGAAVTASAARHKKGDLTSRENSEVLAVESVGR